MNRPPFILFLTGISTSGKTTVYEALRVDRQLRDVEIRDIDEVGAPAAGLGPWRLFRVEELFLQAIVRFRDGESTIICGVTVPHEVLTSKLYEPALNVHFLLLNVPLNVFRQRIEERRREHQKSSALTLEATPYYWETHALHSRRLARELLNEVSNLKNGHLIDTANLDQPALITQTKQAIQSLSSPAT